MFGFDQDLPPLTRLCGMESGSNVLDPEFGADKCWVLCSALRAILDLTLRRTSRIRLCSLRTWASMTLNEFTVPTSPVPMTGSTNEGCSEVRRDGVQTSDAFVSSPDFEAMTAAKRRSDRESKNSSSPNPPPTLTCPLPPNPIRAVSSKDRLHTTPTLSKPNATSTGWAKTPAPAPSAVPSSYTAPPKTNGNPRSSPVVKILEANNVLFVFVFTVAFTWLTDPYGTDKYSWVDPMLPASDDGLGIRYTTPPTVFIGVQWDSLSSAQAHELSMKIKEDVLAKHGMDDVEVAWAETGRRRWSDDDTADMW
ncbi:hypothetical protein NMY22_g17289 [Coprinellus aureogranulatus]|nr:hypothetical protein NMY22_g17289 [Coprinellus aureogranulatus]